MHNQESGFLTATNIASELLAESMAEASRLVPGTRVELIRPQNPDQLRAAVTEHVRYLAQTVDLTEQEAPAFVLRELDLAYERLTGPGQPEVFVRVTVALGEVGIQQVRLLGMMADVIALRPRTDRAS